MCSLFSPMSEFADMETAMLTARLALEAVLDPANAVSSPQNVAAEVPERKSKLAEAAGVFAASVSKRDFLRGAFLGRGDRG
jgi:hypothetical protein